MCGRFTMFDEDDELVALFDIDVMEGEHLPSYNQAPSQWVRAVVGNQPRVLTMQRWGLVPQWAKAGFKPLINARSETLTEKPSFRVAASRRRCLIPTNGYYEWMTQPDGQKQPYFLSAPVPAEAAGAAAQPGPAGFPTPVLAMAGIYEFSRTERGDELVTCAVITRSAPDELGRIHDRMPVFVPPELYTPWLDPELQDRDQVRDLVAAIPVLPLATRPVQRAVGSVRTQDPGLIFG